MTKYDLRLPQNHSDYEILKSALIKEQWMTENEFIRSSFSSSKEYSIESNYIRTNSTRYWNPQLISDLIDLTNSVNEKTEEYDFHLYDVTDYEVEWDGDRSYPASFNIISFKKSDKDINELNIKIMKK